MKLCVHPTGPSVDRQTPPLDHAAGPNGSKLTRSGALPRSSKLVEGDILESAKVVDVMDVDVAAAGVSSQWSQPDALAHDTLLLAEASIRCLLWSVS